MESSDSKLALILGTDVFSLSDMNFHKVVTDNKGRCCSITVVVGPKGSGKLFKLLLIMQKANAITSSSATEAANAIEDFSRLELTVMPILPDQTLAKQCLTNPSELRYLEACLTAKGLDAADAIQTLWVAMRSGTKVDWLSCQQYNEAVIDQKGANCIHQCGACK